jgi:hypothetical protein
MNCPMNLIFEEILDRLLLLDKIEIGLKQSNAGNTVSTDEAKESLSKWLK